MKPGGAAQDGHGGRPPEPRKRYRGSAAIAALARYFVDFEDPYLRLTPEQYVETAERNGLRALRVRTRDETWDFESPAAFFTFCAVGLVAWTQRLPETGRSAFVDDVLDHYRAITCHPAGEETTFRFYQTDFTLVPSDR